MKTDSPSTLSPLTQSPLKHSLPKLSQLAKVISVSLLSVASYSAASDEIEVIEVSVSRIQAKLNEIPASISVITHEDIERLTPNKLSDLLRYQPGISVDKSGDRHGEANINIRGIGGNRVLVVKDGMVMPEGFGSAGTTQGRGNFDPFNLQQVEILKGPASALYGSNALGGVVLMTSADPQSLLADSDGKMRQSFNAGYFSEDERYRVGATTVGKVAAGFGLVQMQHQGFGESDINSDVVNNPKDGQSNNLLVKWKYVEGDDHIIELIADYYKQDADNSFNSQLGPVSKSPGKAITLSTANDQSTVFRAAIKHQILGLDFLDKLQWQLDYQTSNYKQFEQEQVQGSTSSTLEVEWEEFEQKQLGINLLVEKEWGEHQVVAGIDLLGRTLSRPTLIVNNDLIANTKDSGTRSKTFPDADVTQYGAFIQDHFQATDSFKVVAGVRYDYFKNNPKPDEDYRNVDLANSQVATDKFSDDTVSPHLGLVWNFSDQTSLFTNYSTGFRAPPIAKQYISKTIFSRKPHEVIPNTDLGSEQSRGVELGLRWNNELANVEVSAYHNRYDDFIDSKTIGYRGDVRQIQYQNVSEVTIKGFEVSANVLIDSLLPQGWSGDIKAAVSIIDGENSTDATGLNSVSPSNAVIGVSLKPNDQWLFDWHIRAVDNAGDAEPLVSHGRALPAFEPAGYAVQDLSVRYMPNKQFAVSLGLYNAFDKKYWGAHNKGDDASRDLEGSVAAGRNFALTASYSF